MAAARSDVCVASMKNGLGAVFFVLLGFVVDFRLGAGACRLAS
jgi:hypothetical protein